MLKSELYQLEKLIGEVQENNRTAGDPDDIKRLPDQVKSVQTLCAKIKEKWVHELFSPTKEQVITRYVQYHQAGITRLSNQIGREIPAIDTLSEKPVGRMPYYEQILNALEQLLNFLKHQCYKYFDLDYKVTIHCCRRQCDQIDKFRREFSSYSGNEIELTLMEAIGVSVQEMIADALQSGISYRRAAYTLNLLRMVHQLMQAGKGTTTDGLAQALYRQNLNTLHFFNWYQERILLHLTSLPDKHDQGIFIAQQIKAFSVIFVDPEKALEPELPSIDLALLPWLDAKTGGGGKTARMLIKQPIPARLPLNLSVPQFALFIRIFYKAGCFSIDNVAMITRFFTEHFITKKQPHISHKSFGRAFYSLDQSAAAIVQDYLQKMLNYLNKTYFP